jgi:hypothetical protein
MIDPIATILTDQFTVTPTELQLILRSGRKATYRAIAAGTIPHLRVGNNIRISTAWLRKNLGLDTVAA